MSSAPPSLSRQMSMDVPLAPMPANSSELEQHILDAQASDFLENAPGGAGGPDNGNFIMPHIESSQAQEQNEEEDDEDDSAEDALDESYPQLVNKTARMNAITTKLTEMDEQEGTPSTEMLAEMKEAVEGDAESEKKLALVIQLHNTAQNDADLRDFLADLFPALKVRKDNKAKRADLELELKRLSTLYFAQKEKEVLAKLAKDKASLFGKLKGKAAGKIEAKKEKEAKKRELKAETSAAKKAKK